MFCGKCGTRLPDGANVCTTCGAMIGGAPAPAPMPVQTAAPNPSQGMNFDFNTNTATAAASRQRYEYKVLTQKDKWFTGKFDPANLETAMNAYAQQGWRVIGCATADIPGFGATRQEFVTILEREI